MEAMTSIHKNAAMSTETQPDRWHTLADQVLGPYRDEANQEGPTVLQSIPGQLIGPGHNSVVLGPDNQTHFIVYHSWNRDRTRRQMCLDPIEWTDQGPRTRNPARGPKSVTLAK